MDSLFGKKTFRNEISMWKQCPANNAFLRAPMESYRMTTDAFLYSEEEAGTLWNQQYRIKPDPSRYPLKTIFDDV